MNAIIYGGTACRGAEIFVTTEPCNDCLKKIISAGIVRVTFNEPYYHEDMRLRKYLIKESGIDTVQS